MDLGGDGSVVGGVSVVFLVVDDVCLEDASRGLGEDVVDFWT